jgi:hypothetical protein
MSDNTVTRKPIEQLIDDISQIKADMMHVKNYIRKLEIREEIKEQEKIQDKYEILDNNRPEKENQRSWFW